MEKSNCRKSTKNRDKSAIFRERVDFCSFVGPCCARAEEVRLGRFYRRFIGDKFKISTFSRRFFGDLSGIFLALGFFSAFDLTVQISSAFFEKSNGYIFDPTVDFKSEA